MAPLPSIPSQEYIHSSNFTPHESFMATTEDEDPVVQEEEKTSPASQKQ